MLDILTEDFFELVMCSQQVLFHKSERFCWPHISPQRKS